MDTGLNPALLPKDAVLSGRSFLRSASETQWCEPENPHASAVARTILASVPQTRFVSARILDRAGELDDLAVVAEAFQWVADQRERLGISLVCCAIADLTHNQSDLAYRGTALQRSLGELRAAGVITVMPAGNFRMTRPGDGMPWPAILREVVSVGALTTGAPSPLPAALMSRETGQSEGRPAARDAGAGCLTLAPTSQRLRRSDPSPCHTTLFALPREPGQTSGACAAVVGALAAIALQTPQASSEECLEYLLARCVPLQDEEGRTWRAMPAAL